MTTNPADTVRELAQIPNRAAASACFGEPTSAGDRIAIPVAEVMYGLGFGWGSGTTTDDGEQQSGTGGGGGGGSRVRGVAVVEISPEGVRVHPIRDETAITLAGITFASAALAITARTLQKLLRG